MRVAHTALAGDLPLESSRPSAPSRGAPSRLRRPQPWERSRAPYFQEGRLITLALLAALSITLALSFDSAGWVESMGPVALVVLGGLAAGVLMAYSRFDGLFMLTYGVTTGLAWVLFLMTRMVGQERRVQAFVDHGVPELQARAYFLLERWLTWLEAALSRGPSNDNYTFVLEIAFLLWWLAYLGGWMVFRHGTAWRTVVSAGLVLLVNVYYAPRPITGFLVAYCVFATLFLAWTNLVSHRQRWQVRGIHYSQDIAFDFMRVGLLYALAVVAIGFVGPNLGRNPLLHRIMAPVNQRWNQATSEWNRLYQGLNRQARPVQSVFDRTLSLGGPRNVTDRPIFEVETTTGRYWRAVTYDTFTGRQWINTATTEVTFDPGARLPVVPWALRQPVTQTITLAAPMGDVVVAPPDLLRTSVPIAAIVSPVLGDGGEDTELTRSEFTLVRSREPLEPGDSYTVVSYYTQVTVRDLRNAPTEYPAAIVERYLQLPENVSPRVVQLAQEIAQDATTVYDKAKAIESFLRGYQYDDQIEAPPPDQDPVEYFLFDIQRGYCNYYATAMAVMLRALGIPARMASGYAEGTLDRETGRYIVTERDSHTWVEVFFPGLGWIEFEPTAGESVLDRPLGEELADSSRTPGMPEDRSRNQDLPQMDDALYPELEQLEALNQLPGEEPGGLLATASPRAVGGLVVASLFAVLGGVWLLRRRFYQGPQAFTLAPASRIYAQMLDGFHRLGVMVRTSQTPYERAQELATLIPPAGPWIGRITEIYVRHRYGPYRRLDDPRTERELQESWQALRGILRRTWIRRLLRRWSPVPGP